MILSSACHYRTVIKDTYHTYCSNEGPQGVYCILVVYIIIEVIFVFGEYSEMKFSRNLNDYINFLTVRHATISETQIHTTYIGIHSSHNR